MLDKSLHRLIDHADIISSVSPTIWEKVAVRSVWWDGVNNVFTPARDNETYDVILGSAWRRSMREHVDRLRYPKSTSSRWKDHFEVGIPLPADALIIRPFSVKGTVIASRSTGTVLKFMPPRSPVLHKLDNESEALRIATTNGLTHSIPRLLNSGSCSGGKWMTSTLAPNTRPFVKRFQRLSFLTWRGWLLDHVYPLLAEYYTAAGLTTTSAASRLSKCTLRASNVAISERLGFLMESELRKLREIGDIECFSSRVHGDLVPGHVHRSGDSWKLIDWGESRGRDLSFEFFKPYWRSPLSKSERGVSFWNWVSGSAAYQEIHWIVRSEINLARTFYYRYLNTDLSMQELRMIVRISMLEEVVETAEMYGHLDDELLSRPDLWANYDELLLVDLHRMKFLGV